ncbi:MAG: hypothetical protein JSV49_02450 [Thermoplasmata archaeon]|nr:MAG: hypothetical protein JSV49_02450 [Thermoplasmata archaeon]
MHRHLASSHSAGAAGCHHTAQYYTGRRAVTFSSATYPAGQSPPEGAAAPRPVALEAGTGTGPGPGSLPDAQTHPISISDPLPFLSPDFGSEQARQSMPRVEPGAKLRTGIPRVDRFLSGGCVGGQITLFEGPADFILDLSSRFAVNGAAALRRPVMFIDGGNSADPYGFATVCRRAHYDPHEILARIYIARAFTVYQLDTLLVQMVEERINALGPAVVIVSFLNTMYLDPDVNWDEARAIFQNDLRILRELTVKYQVATLVTNPTGHKSYHAMELARALRASAEHRIDIKAKSKYKLRMVRNGSEVMDYRPLPPYQCSLDEFCPGGVIHG